MKKTQTTNVKKAAAVAMMTALYVVLERMAAINVWNMKLNVAFIPLMVVAYLFGPVGSITVAVLGDIIGTLLFPTGAYFPGFTATAALTGLIFGFALKNDYSTVKSVSAIVINQLLVSLLANTLMISYLFGTPFKTLLFSTRIWQAIVMTAVEIIFAQLFFKKVDLRKILKFSDT